MEEFDLSMLTPREREISQLLAQGKRLVEVAAMLHIEYDTAKKHMASAREKTGSSTTMQLAIKAAGVLRQE